MNDGGVCRTAPATPGLLNTSPLQIKLAHSKEDSAVEVIGKVKPTKHKFKCSIEIIVN